MILHRRMRRNGVCSVIITYVQPFCIMISRTNFPKNGALPIYFCFLWKHRRIPMLLHRRMRRNGDYHEKASHTSRPADSAVRLHLPGWSGVYALH